MHHMLSVKFISIVLQEMLDGFIWWIRLKTEGRSGLNYEGIIYNVNYIMKHVLDEELTHCILVELA